MAERIEFTRDEIEQYFDRISLPKHKRVFDVSSLTDTQKLDYLFLLHKHEACKVPWENLAQHYSWHHVVHLKPRHLYRKIVGNPGRGGYCMEANYFFHLILVSLHFQVYMAGSRIYRPGLGKFGGWTHVVNLVTIAGVRYLLDCGYGGPVSTRPLPLEDGTVSTQVSPSQMRVVHQPLAQNLDQSQKVWIYQHRFDQTSEWINHYCFVDFEFTPEDIWSMNFDPWRNPASMFTHTVVIARHTTNKEVNDEAGPGSPGEAELEGEIDGWLSIWNDTLKWRRHGAKVLEIVFETDAMRVDAFKKYFGIQLAEEDVEGIRGTAAEIRAKGM